MNRFRYVLEKELFRLYFSSFTNIDRNIYNLKLFSPKSNTNIKSAKYVVHFLKKGKVAQEITVNFRLLKNKTKIIIKKHILSELNKEHKLFFPEQVITLITPKQNQELCVEFTRFEDRFFVVKIADQVEGFLTFGTDKNYRVDLEAVVKCYLTIDNSFHDSNINLLIKKPSMNKDSFNLKLTNQYRLNCCKHPKSNKITIFNIGTTKIKFDKFKATIYSISSSPKIKTTVIEKGDYYDFIESIKIY